MKTFLVTALVGALAGASVTLGGCSGCGSDSDNLDGGVDGNADNTFDQCGGDPASFARQAFLALDGRRPRSQAEVDVYVDLYKAAEVLGDDPKDTVARAIMSRPEFMERWVDVVMDALHVQRVDIQSEEGCWADPLRATVTPALAMAIRDKSAAQGGDGQTFTMLDLARSSLALDDLTPIYRGQLFSLVSHPIPAANVPRIDAELARRADFGQTFDAGYLHRDQVCLGCHNSEASVTDNDDPQLDRFWPVPGTAEKALFGISTGVASERAHAPFRVDNFVDNGTTRPWGWTSSCGSFAAPASVGVDIAGVDAKLGSITGMRSTVYDVEASLLRGFTALRGTALPGDAAISDPDTALAWLVTLKITEDVWRQATGTSLTIANYFPRNQAASDQLYALATRFAQSGFSLRTLLSAIVSSDYFNRQAPDLQCGAEPYTYPNVFDPWVIADADPAKRKNGPGDAVTSIDAHTLFSATAAALEWTESPSATRFLDAVSATCQNRTCTTLQGQCTSNNQCCPAYQSLCVELPFERSVGVFLRNSERGFRGLDFQARLAWENRYGSCARPTWVAQDFIDRLVAAGAADPSATGGDVVSALKDRLIGEPVIQDGSETAALATVVGALDAPATAISASNLRRVCGALLESPQFLLQGIAGKGGPRPKLTPATASYDTVCADLAATGIGVAGRVVTCGPAGVAFAMGRIAPVAPATGPVRLLELPDRRVAPPAREPAPTHHM
jgi:hypothetical protein